MVWLAYGVHVGWQYRCAWVRAKDLYEAGKYADAVPALERCAELVPDDADAHYWLGNALGLTGRIDEAVVAFRRAVDLEPGNADYHADLGNALGLTGDRAGAVIAYRRASDLRPQDAWLRVGIGYELGYQNKWKAAAEEFRRALQLDPRCRGAEKGLRDLKRRPRPWVQEPLRFPRTGPPMLET